ncbi:hypothetical protein D3I61_23010 [Escherichia coli]|nr:hypothetical protein D3I61_23010 [Escherichia coli]
MACKFFPGPVSRIAGMPDTAPSGAVFFIPSAQQVRTQGPIRHADCRQRKLADFLCTGGIIQGLISAAHQAIIRLSSVTYP